MDQTPTIKKTINKKFAADFFKEYWRRLDDVTKKYIGKCMEVHGYKIPEKGICDKTLKQFSIKLAKKHQKLVVFIVTNNDERDLYGNTIIRMHIYCEIVKMGLKLGTYQNMIIKRFPKVVSKHSKWEGCDYSKVYGIS